MTQYCAHCGSPLRPGSTFCGECGTAVASPDAATSPADQPTQPLRTADATPAPYPTPVSDGSADEGADRGSEERRPGTHRGVVLGVAAAALAVVLGVVIAATFLNREHPADNAAPATSNSAQAPTSPRPSASSTTTAGASAATPTYTASSSATPGASESLPDPEAQYRTYRRGTGTWGRFTKVATLHDTTSEGFMYNVAQAYADSGADGGPVVLRKVESVEAERSFDMTCSPQPQDYVRCTGGKHADVLLYR